MNSFCSEPLRKAVEAARPILETIEESRNRLSNDIKALESYLQSVNLKEEFTYPLGKSFECSNDSLARAQLESEGCADGEIIEDCLAWGMDRNGNSRLLYMCRRWDGSVDPDVPGGPFFWDEATFSSVAMPLIEAKFEVRKRMSPHLPAFVSALAAHFGVDRRERPIDPDDIPF